MAWTVGEVAGWVSGEVVGDGGVTVSGLRPLADARAGELTFVDGPKNQRGWDASPAAAAVVPTDFPPSTRPLIRVADPLLAFQSILLRIRGVRTVTRTVHPTAVVHPTATVGENASLGPNVVVGEGTAIGANVTVHAGAVIGRFCTVGDDSTLHPRVVIYDDCTIGQRVVIHAGAVIGTDGFGYRLVKGQHQKLAQIGGVEIGDDVEIGANCTIDCGTVGPTRIGAGTKIDNLVMVAHNCQIGRHNIIIAQAGIAGSSSTGDYVILAGQAGIADHVHIGDGAVIGAQCGVTQDVPAKARMLGSPAMSGSDYMRCVANWQKVPELRKSVAKVLKHLKLDE